MNRSTSARPKPPDDVFFPVVPMLDMAFQLLAFFILTFQAPSTESWIGLDLPVTPAALPKSTDAGRPLADPDDRSVRLRLRATADRRGGLAALELEGESIGTGRLAERLRSAARGSGRPVRLTIAADDALRYEEAVRLLVSCQRAGVSAVRLDRLDRVARREGGPP